MDNNNFDYFYNEQSEKHLFLSIPLFLIKDEKFKKLSGDAKILYGLFLSRTSLSIKNNWKDEKGRVYIIYSIKEIMQDLGCWEQKVNKTLKELKEIGLIEIKRQGINKPNLLYIKNFASLQNSKNSTNSHEHWNCENHKSGIVKITNLKLRKSQSSNIDINNIDINNKEKGKKNVVSCHVVSCQKKKRLPSLLENSSIVNKLHTETKKISASVQHTTSNEFAEQKAQIPIEYNYSTYRKILQDNINYNNLVNIGYREIKLVDDCINIMLDVIWTEEPYIKIDKESKPREMIRNTYLEINQGDILYVIDRYQETKKKITNKANFLKTLLYYSKLESNAHYENLFRSGSDNIDVNADDFNADDFISKYCKEDEKG